MATSTIYNFEQAFKANLSKRANLANTTITDGPPTTGELASGEWIMLGNAQGSQTWKTFPISGSFPREEMYTIDVLINVVQAVNDAQTKITERAFALLAEIEN